MRRPDPWSERRCRTLEEARKLVETRVCRGDRRSPSLRTRARARRSRLSACATERRCVRFACYVCAQQRAACQPGARPPAGGWIGSASMPAAGDHPGDHRVRVPHLARAQLIASPHRGRNLRDELEDAAGTRLRRRSGAAGCRQPRRRPECVRRARDGSRSGRSEGGRPNELPTGPSATTPRCVAAQVPDRSLLDHERRPPGARSGARSDRGRRPDAAAARRQRLVDATVEPDEVPAGAERQPVQSKLGTSRVSQKVLLRPALGRT